MALLDLLGRRMTLRVLWELHRAGRPMTFRALQEAAETNPAVLNTRLKELRAAGFVSHDESGYVLSDQGVELVRLLLPLNDRAAAWASRSDKRRMPP
jgi:DNA-binding HxlR family transcriptional regulator